MKINILTTYKNERQKIKHPVISLSILLLVTIFFSYLGESIGIAGIKSIIAIFNIGNATKNNYAYVDLFFTIIPILVILIYQKYINAHSIFALGLKTDKILKYIIMGSLFGLVSFSLTFVLNYLIGVAKPNFQTVNYFYLGLFLLGFIIHGFSEEIIFRGLLFPEISATTNIYIGAFISSIIFALAHLSNPGFNLIAAFNLFLFSITTCTLYYKFQNIWIIGFAHAFWNFAQGNIFGVAVSGFAHFDSFINTILDDTSILNGGAFGFEAGLICTAIMLVANILIILTIKRRKNAINNQKYQ